MADFNSKYTGKQVEEFLDQLAAGNSTITEEEITAMGFTKNLGTITEVKMNGVSKGTSGVVDLGDVITEHQDISGKVDKVSGKQLSTEDFTTVLKNKLDGLSNYDDAEVSAAIEQLRTDFDTLVSGDTATAIESFNEIIAFLNGIEDSDSLDSIIASIEQQIAGKYTKPSTGVPKADLASDVQTSLGKADTALQSYTEQYTGTVKTVKINGEEKTPDSNGLVDLGTIEGGSSTTTVDGIVMKVETITPLNGVIAFVDGGIRTVMKANTIYVQDSNTLIESVDILEFEETDDAYARYALVFKFAEDKIDCAGLNFPSDVLWANGEAPTIEVGVVYELDIVRSTVAGSVTYTAVCVPFKAVE